MIRFEMATSKRISDLNLCPKLGLMQVLVLLLLLTRVMELMMKKLSKITRVSESPPVSFHKNPANNASEHATNQSSCSSDEEGIDNVDRE